MKFIWNDRGGLLVYAFFLILLISVLTLPLLTISSTRDLADRHDHNQKVANNLVVSMAEDYLDYLSRCVKCDEPDYYKQFDHIGETIQFFLPDGTPVSYHMYFEASENDEGDENKVIVFSATAGEGKFEHSKTIKYDLISSITPIAKDVIDPLHPVIPKHNDWYFGYNQIQQWLKYEGLKDYEIDYRIKKWPKSEVTGAPIVKAYDGPPVQPALAMHLNNLAASILDKMSKKQQLYENHTNVVNCANWNSCKKDDINTLISNNSNKNPLIIKAGKVELNVSQNITIGAPTQKIILLTDHMAINNESKLTYYGDIIVRNNVTSYNNPKIEMHGDFIASELTADGGLQFNQGLASIPTSNFLIKNQLTISNTSEINVTDSFYAGDFYNNRSEIHAKEIIVKNSLSGHNGTLNAKDQIVLGSANITSSFTFITQMNDFFIVNDFTTTNSDAFKIAGSMAIGGTLNMSNAPSYFTLGYQFNADGTLKKDANGRPIPGQTIFNSENIHAGSSGGGQGGGGSEAFTWKPRRK